MEATIQLKTFKCPIHPSESIQRVLQQSQASKLLYCTECAVESDSNTRSSLTTLDHFVDDLYSHWTNSPANVIRTKPPDSLISILDQEEENLYKFSEYISSQKRQANDEFKRIEGELLSIIHNTRDSILSDLDMQLNVFKKNYEDYRAKLSKYFNYGKKQKNSLTKEDFISELNSCASLLDLELKVKSCLREVEATTDMSPEPTNGYESVILDNLKLHVQSLENMNAKYPECILNQSESFKEQEEKIKSLLESLMKDCIKIENQISLKLSPIDTSILTLEETDLLRSFIFPDYYKVPLTLIARAKEDSSNYDEIGELASTNSNILVLLRTHKGEILGCYRKASSYSPTMKEQMPSKTIAFNLTQRIKREETQPPPNTSGFYGLAYSLYLTAKAISGYNMTIISAVKQAGSLKLEDYICLCLNHIESGYDASIPSKPEEWNKIVHGVSAIEVFEVKV